MSVELDLTGTIDDQVVIFVSSQFIFQPIEVVQQVPVIRYPPNLRGSLNSLEAIYQTTVRTKLQLLHDVLKVDQIADIEGRLIVEPLGCRVEVDQVHRPSEGLGMGDEGRAEGGLARPSGACDHYGVTHDVGEEWRIKSDNNNGQSLEILLSRSTGDHRDGRYAIFHLYTSSTSPPFPCVRP